MGGMHDTTDRQAAPQDTRSRQVRSPLHMRAPWANRYSLGLLILRVGVALMMLCHGVPKLLLLLQGRGSQWMDPLGFGSTLSLLLCTFAEFGCSMAILLGLFTRLASFVLVVNFGVIIFIYDGGGIWPQSELPLLYLICFFTLLCTGSGPLSLDAFVRHRRNTRF